MPEIKVLNMAGAEVGKMDLSDKVFGAEVKTSILHSAVRAYLMNQAAAKSPGDRRAAAAQDRVPPALPSGRTAVWLSVRSPAPIR